MKRATTIDEQIERLQKRGMSINDKERAVDILLDKGYYQKKLCYFQTSYQPPRPSICTSMENVEIHFLWRPNQTNRQSEGFRFEEEDLYYGICKLSE